MVRPVGVGERPVFTAGGKSWTWADVVDAARLRGGWASLERATLAGLACARRLESSDEAPDRALIEESARQFRYQRRLLAGDEMEAWLTRWGLGASDLRGYLVRALLRERWRNELDAIIDAYPVNQDDVDLALWGEAVFSGLLERSAQDLAADVALALASGEVPRDGVRTELPTILTIAERMRAAEDRRDGIEREVAAHRLEWLRVDGEAVELESEDAAREAVLRVREDGQSFRAMAAEIGSEARAFSLYLSDIDDDQARALMGAQAGELVGPRAQGGRFVLLLVTGKELPTPADPAVRQKALDRIVARAVDRAVGSHVQWHERL